MTFKLFAAVIPDRLINKPLDYGVPDSIISKIKAGSRVSITIRGNECKGTVLTLSETSKIYKIEPILEVLSEDCLSEDLFKLISWMSSYYCTSINKSLLSVLPSSIKKNFKEQRQLLIEKNVTQLKLITYCEEIRSKYPKQAKVLDIILINTNGILLTELLQKNQITKGPVKTLIENKILKSKKVQVNNNSIENEEFFQTKPKILSGEQQNTLQEIDKSISSNLFETHLIHGITGSGKTEIYLQAISKALSFGKGVIMLVPEISLTMQTIEQLKSRLQTKIAILHHKLSDRERFDTWHKIRKKEIQVVIGARSAIFSPVPNLGLIIVDEEHENSYKQSDEAPCYHARDIAVMRGKITSSTVILGSATPSIESYFNAKNGKYKLHTLTHRPINVTRPKVEIVDMKDEMKKNGGFTLFSDILLQKIKKRIEDGEQTLLFLNRRGYYTCQVCSSCFKTQKCHHCDTSLTYHKSENILSCHICSFTLKPPIEKCINCGAVETLKYRGPGTEQVERSLHSIFKDVKTLRIDRDTTKHKGSLDKIFKQFRSGKGDILIGTQMIAKGLHFPNVTLVGILNADSSLNIPDFRSDEHTFSLITQVAGRSGRGDLPGEVIIQSILPNHKVINLASNENYLEFFTMELKEREMFDYPPFSKLVKIIFSGKDCDKVKNYAEDFKNMLAAKLNGSFTFHNVIPCGYAKIKDNYRFQIMAKGIDVSLISQSIKSLQISKLSSVRVLIDVNPISTW